MSNDRQNEPFRLDRVVMHPQLLETCCFSLLRLATGNALLVTWHQDGPIDPLLYLQLADIAKLIQQQQGNTWIYLRHYQQDVILSWTSQDVLHLSRIWNIQY